MGPQGRAYLPRLSDLPPFLPGPVSLWSWMVLCAEPEHTYLSTNFLNTFEFEVWRKLPVNLNLPGGQSRNSGSQEL